MTYDPMCQKLLGASDVVYHLMVDSDGLESVHIIFELESTNAVTRWSLGVSHAHTTHILAAHSAHTHMHAAHSTHTHARIGD